jgi:DNA primase
MSLGHLHLTPQFVQAVRDAVDIVPIAEDHTRLQKRGQRYQGLCPLHKEKTPSFSVDPDQNLFYCFGCGAGGDAIKLHMMVSGDDFPAAVESLARRFGVPLPQASAGPARSARRDLEGVLEAANAWFRRQLSVHDDPRRYLEDREVSPELVERFELGYAPPGWEDLLAALQGRFPARDLEAAGLVSPSRQRAGEHYDRFRHRLIFPIRTASGRLVGFGGRTLGDDKAKYVNTPETEEFRKGSILYGLHLAKRSLRETGRAVLAEGYFDVIATVAAGVEEAVASMGTALTPEQARLLARYAEEVVVAYDGDRAGEEAHRRALPILLRTGLAVRRLELAAGADPDTIRLEEGDAVLLRGIEAAPDAVERELGVRIPADGPRQPQRQGRYADEVAELLTAIPDPIVRYAYGRRAAERIGIPFDLLAPRLRGSPRRDAEPRPSPRSSAPEPAADRPERLPARGLEDGTIRVLVACLREAVSGETPAGFPAPSDLVPPEVFGDPDCRNFFAAFRDLYGDGETPRLPPLEEVRSALHGAGHGTDFLARILLAPGGETGEPSRPKVGPGDRFAEYTERLFRNWLKERRKVLAGQIRQADAAGDVERLEALRTEKGLLDETFYGRSMPGNE